MTPHQPNTSPRAIELLAPARNADIAIEAIRHGADAVYIGAEFFGARSAAGNSIDDISRLVQFAHAFHARVFVTLNTILYDDELDRARRLVDRLYAIGVDALIIQDLGLLRLDLPPIELHASTQCNINSPERALFLQNLGMSRLILPRELTLDETRAIADTVDIELEAFVHGALCVSYSGDCQAGAALAGRSANRGCCPQICRHLYTLEDEQGRALMAPRHLLSLRDLNRTDLLAPMIEAGISSFKIEGRLKDTGYVKNIVAHYRRALDTIIDANPGRYRRASLGRVEFNFTPDPALSFNRGFTTYFSTERRPQGARMACLLTPKWAGVKIGTVEAASGTRLTCRLSQPVSNGDGLAFFTPQSTLEGFNVNTGARPPKGVITTQRPLNIPAGTPLYRNFDKLTADRLQRDDTARRLIDINITLRRTPFGLALDATTPDASLSVSATAVTPIDQARTPQADMRRDLLCRTGGTNYNVASVADLLDADAFVAKSVLTSLRRNLVAALDHAVAATHRYGYRRPESPDATAPERLTYHDNVANHLARELYTSHGATEIEPALELRDSIAEGTRVMTTRYCLRRELGACLRTPAGSRLPQPLFIRSGPIRLALNFDCKNCEMHVIK